MPFKTSQEKMAYELAATIDAEQQLLQGMQQLQGQATDPQLQQQLERHITQTQQQVEQLQQLVSQMGGGQQQQCAAARGLVADAQKVTQEAGTPELRDAAIGAAWLKGEHFEVATYRGLVMGAQMMGQQQAQQILQQILQQEDATAQQIEGAMPQILQKAMQAEAVAAD
jgi:ferritin-like metal-binding protein YciE